MAKNTITITTFDTFTIKDELGNVITYGNKPHKIWQVFKLLLINYNQVIHYEFIYEQLEIEHSNNIYNLIKNMIYRLRKQLINLELYDDNFILIDSFPESYCLKIGKNVNLDIKNIMDLSLDKTNLQYISSVLPKNHEILTEERYSEWVLQKRSFYSNHLMKLYLSYSELQFESERYNDAIEMANRALNISSYDENALTIIIKSLIAQDRRVNALKIYYEFEDRLYEDFGLNPSEELQNIGESLNDTKSIIKKKVVKNNGAFWCSTKEFKTIWLHEKRKHERGDEKPIYCKVKIFSMKTASSDKKLNKINEIIVQELRGCDVISSEKNGIINVLLYNTTHEKVKSIENRIVHKVNAIENMEDIDYQIDIE